MLFMETYPRPGGEHVNFSRQTGAQTILPGRDFFNDTSMPGYAPYTYPHL